MFPLPNTPPGALVQDLQRLRRKYESARLEHLKKVREVVNKAATEEREYLKAVFSSPKKIDDQE
jgi:hypothetical protein